MTEKPPEWEVFVEIFCKLSYERGCQEKNPPVLPF
jgi:hypothetical protein